MYLILMAMSVIIVLIGINMIYNKKITKKNSIQTDGTIINYEEYVEMILDPSNQLIPVKVFKPTIEFTTYDNKKITFLAESNSSRKILNEGDKVSILYSKKNPNDCCLLSDVQDLSLEFTIIGGGAVLFITAIIIYLL